VAAAPVDGTVATAARRWSQLPKAEVVLAVSLVLYGGGIFIANTQHKQTDTFNQ
jgi:hypothetical protein